MKTDIMGIAFDNVTMQEAVERAMELISERRCAYCATPNPEIVMLAKEDAALREFYRALAALRKYPALRTGAVTVLDSGGGRFSFRRTLAGERTLFVCCNRAGDWTLQSAHGRLLLSGGVAEYTPERLTLAPGGFAIIEE